MSKRNVGELTVDTLARAGVRRIYGVVGDSLNAVTEAIRRQRTIEWVHVRNEEAGAFAAGAEAQLSGRLSSCGGSCGPGNLHLINGLYDCHRSGAPVLAIAAHIPSGEIGTGFFQETHPTLLFQECSHYCELISSPAQMPRVLQIAMQHAVGRGGVGVVVLPGDVAKMPADTSKSHDIATTYADVRPGDADLGRLVAIINDAKRITLLCGIGCMGAHDEVMALAARIKSPIVHTLRGKNVVETNNPFDVGMTGLIGFRSGFEAMESSDLLLMLGTDFPYDDWYPAKAKIAQIELRAERLGRRSRLDLGVVGHVRETLIALLPLVNEKTDRSHLDRGLGAYRSARDELDKLARARPSGQRIRPEYVTATLNDTAADDAIFTADTGMSTVWAARYLRMSGSRQLLGSFIHGSMANALPQAIGAQALFPKRQVVSMSGDGGFAMLMGDLLTLHQYSLPIKLVVYNNGALGMVELEQAVAGYPPFGVDLVNPNFARIAEAAGITGIRVEDSADVRDAVAQALRTDGPVLVDVTTDPRVLSMPPHITFDEMKGFSLALIKETLSGNVDEVAKYAEANVR
jgi:pyruvate dehydrogenase (quinone)